MNRNYIFDGLQMRVKSNVGVQIYSLVVEIELFE